MELLILVLAHMLLASLHFKDSSSIQLDSKIIDGQPSDDEKAKCVVRIGHINYHGVLNGALISRSHVICSGGHFGALESPRFLGQYFIQIGLISLENPRQINMIKRIIRPKGYEYDRNTNYEFAIIVMLQEVKLSEDIWLIPLQKEDITCLNNEVTVYGWGATEPPALEIDVERYSRVLIKYEGAFIYTGKADKNWNKGPRINVLSKEGTSILGVGDSGAVAIAGHQLVGIAFYSYLDLSSLVSFTSIPFHHKFIQDVIDNNYQPKDVIELEAIPDEEMLSEFKKCDWYESCLDLSSNILKKKKQCERTTNSN